MRYLYISCTGNDFDLDYKQSYEQASCSQCGDTDTYVGTYETDKEREEVLEEYYNRYY